MTAHIKWKQTILLACLCMPMVVLAQPTFGVKMSTLGYGIEAALALSEKMSVRVNYHRINLNLNTTQDDIEYDVDLKFNTLATLLDWHPRRGGFRISGGVLVNNNEFKSQAIGQNEKEYDIGDETYTGDFTLTGKIAFRKIAPYLGIGWGMPPSKKRGWSLLADIGVLYHGQPQIELNASGKIVRKRDKKEFNDINDPEFSEDLAKEQQKLNDDIKDWAFYPVVSLGFAYQF